MKSVATNVTGMTSALILAGVLLCTWGRGQDELPSLFAGSWTGTVHDDSPPGSDYPFEANLYGGWNGQLVGTFAYLSCCGGNLRLLEVSDPQVELAEEYTFNSCGCITTDGRVRLVPVDTDTLRFEWHYAGDTRIWVYGQLRRRVEGFLTETIEGYLVTAPNGSQLWTKIIQPRADVYRGQAFPAVVSVPGLTDPGENDDLRVAVKGVIEFHFNAEGRGQRHPSEGVENLNGFTHQDDLKAVIEFARSRPNVLNSNLGVVTFSYGVTMGSGCLSRYPHLGVKFLIDCEGPSDSYVIGGEPWTLAPNPSYDIYAWLHDNFFHHYSLARDPSPENVAFWSERQATLFIGNISCRYLRLQAEWDHVQPPSAGYPSWDYPPLWYAGKHAIDLVNLATLGNASWTRMNGSSLGNMPNKTYGPNNPPIWYNSTFNAHTGELERVVLEMVNMPLEYADCNQNGIPDEDDISSGRCRDCNGNGVPDECEPDCDRDGIPNSCEIVDGAPDCNANGIPDACDIASGTGVDVNQNGIPDECEPQFKRGDTNASNAIDIADAIFTLTYLFAKGTPPSCGDAADANDSGTIDIADAIALLNHLFAHTGPLLPPFGECGIDPTTTDDTLDCASFPPCAGP